MAFHSMSNMEFLFVSRPTADDAWSLSLRLSKLGERAFCRTCHSILAMRYKHQPEEVGLAMGSVTNESITDEKVKEAFKLKRHIFVSQKAEWYNPSRDGIEMWDRFSGSFEEEMRAAEGNSG